MVGSEPNGGSRDEAQAVYLDLEARQSGEVVDKDFRQLSERANQVVVFNNLVCLDLLRHLLD